MRFVKKFVNNYDKYCNRVEDYGNLFPVKNVQYFELNQKGKPTKLIQSQNHAFFVELNTRNKIPVTLGGLLAKNQYIAEKQSFLMQIMQVEKDIQRAKYIYNNWDWLEFLIYQQSVLSLKVLES